MPAIELNYATPQQAESPAVWYRRVGVTLGVWLAAPLLDLFAAAVLSRTGYAWETFREFFFGSNWTGPFAYAYINANADVSLFACLVGPLLFCMTCAYAVFGTRRSLIVTSIGFSMWYGAALWSALLSVTA